MAGRPAGGWRALKGEMLSVVVWVGGGGMRAGVREGAGGDWTGQGVARWAECRQAG